VANVKRASGTKRERRNGSTARPLRSLRSVGVTLFRQGYRGQAVRGGTYQKIPEIGILSRNARGWRGVLGAACGNNSPACARAMSGMGDKYGCPPNSPELMPNSAGFRRGKPYGHKTHKSVEYSAFKW
jgi:hypothetical protein